MINLAIIGYGKMGKQIESIIDSNEFKVVSILDVNDNISQMSTATNVAIEFTAPKSVLANIEALASRGINIVCGTTGWYHDTDRVKAIISKYGTGFVYASNFSIGVNLFFQIVRSSGGLMDKFKQYNAHLEETHHTEKLDKPSGTAIRAAEFLMEALKDKTSLTNDKNSPAESELNIISKRIENAVGNHKVIFESESDTITLEHNAKSRRGFAEGALMAAGFIDGKKGFYKFEDIFLNLI
jgi:4-hydroxy-tetrahydrodipicolinate reductase